MSKVVVSNIEISEYICTALDYLRNMPKTGDYSALPSLVERIQMHANAMEDGLSNAFKARWRLIDTCENKELSDAEFRQSVMEDMSFYINKRKDRGND